MPSSPASYFHLLRWQGLSGRAKPLIVFTPKSMLRLKAAASAMADFATGTFRPVVPDAQVPDPAAVRRVLLCSGKIYYDLAERRASAGLTDTAILRLECLYPLPTAEIAAELAKYPGAAEVIWVQEEPANMGGWPYMALHLPEAAGRRVLLVSRPASSAPASGSAKAHAAEQAALVAAALQQTG
jgi:2-oxoglutarate dehydrogenase E1 component